MVAISSDKLGQTECLSETGSFYDSDNVVADVVGGIVSKQYVTPFLDQNLSMTTGGQTYYYSQDGLGSVRTLTDSAGGVVNNYDYSGFGEKWTPGTTETVSQRYQFTGRAKNPVSGTQYNRYRTYFAGVGRFGGRDPILYLGGINLYFYVNGKVAFMRDPYGMNETVPPVTPTDFDPKTDKKYPDEECCCTVSIIVKVPTGKEKKLLGRLGLSGHAGIAVENEFYDYGCQPGMGAAFLGSPGRPWWDGMSCMTNRCNAEGKPDATLEDIEKNIKKVAEGHDVYKCVVKTTKEKCDKLEKVWKNIYKKPGKFRVWARTCTTTTWYSLRKSGIHNRPWWKPKTIRRPKSLLKELMANLKHSCGKKSGQKAECKKILAQ